MSREIHPSIHGCCFLLLAVSCPVVQASNKQPHFLPVPGSHPAVCICLSVTDFMCNLVTVTSGALESGFQKDER